MPDGSGPSQFVDPTKLLFTGCSIKVMDTAQYVVTESWEDKPETFTSLGLLPAFRQAFIGIAGRAEILALTAESPECSPPKHCLSLAYPGTWSTEDACAAATLPPV